MRTVLHSLFARFQQLSPTKRKLSVILGLCSGILLVSSVPKMSTTHPQSPAAPHASSVGRPTEQEIDTELKAQWERIRAGSKEIAPLPSAAGLSGIRVPEDMFENDKTPLIAHAADLAVTTKEFVRARTSLEEILDRHHGYAARLRMVGQPAGSILTATLRVPSSEFGATVDDLKTLGNVEREEQTADEITQQRADLEARLMNAQRSLAHLQGILAKGGKVTDQAEVQRQLSNVNGEIARLEAERLASEHRVIFAQVLFSLREVVPPPVESLATQFRSAAVTGFSDVLATVSAIAISAISRGPVVFLWVVLIYFPARWAWRKWCVAASPIANVAQGA